MNVTPIRSPAVTAPRKSVSADFADNACAQGLTVCRAHILIIASHLIETGRFEQAKVLTDAAGMVDGVGKDIQPPSPPGNANEAAGAR